MFVARVNLHFAKQLDIADVNDCYINHRGGKKMTGDRNTPLRHRQREAKHLSLPSSSVHVEEFKEVH